MKVPGMDAACFYLYIFFPIMFYIVMHMASKSWQNNSFSIFILSSAQKGWISNAKKEYYVYKI